MLIQKVLNRAMLKQDLITMQRFDGYAVIKYNRPERKNAIVVEMTIRCTKFLNEAAVDDSIKIVILTGTGDYFTSGADFVLRNSNFEAKASARERSQPFRLFVEAFINFPKPLIAAVNGPAIGVGVTTLGLCDLVYASERSTFRTPFTLIGLIPEACSSYTFPKIMGYAKANAMLMFNHTMNAIEAKESGLVTDILPGDQILFWEQIITKVKDMLSYPEKCHLLGKQLLRGIEKDKLLDVNRNECERLIERHLSPDVVIQAAKFVQKRKILKEQRKARL